MNLSVVEMNLDVNYENLEETKKVEDVQSDCRGEW